MSLIAEDMLLLLLDDEKGTIVGTSHPQIVLGGAMLIELATTGTVTVEEKKGMWKSAKVRVQPGSLPDDRLLRRAADAVAEKERSGQDLVNRLGKGVQDELLGRLEQRGVLSAGRTRSSACSRGAAGRPSTPPTRTPYAGSSPPRSSRACSPTSTPPA